MFPQDLPSFVAPGVPPVASVLSSLLLPFPLTVSSVHFSSALVFFIRAESGSPDYDPRFLSLLSFPFAISSPFFQAHPDHFLLLSAKGLVLPFSAPQGVSRLPLSGTSALLPSCRGCVLVICNSPAHVSRFPLPLPLLLRLPFSLFNVLGILSSTHHPGLGRYGAFAIFRPSPDPLPCEGFTSGR